MCKKSIDRLPSNPYNNIITQTYTQEIHFKIKSVKLQTKEKDSIGQLHGANAGKMRPREAKWAVHFITASIVTEEKNYMDSMGRKKNV